MVNYHQVVIVMDGTWPSNIEIEPSYFHDIIININQAIKEWALKSILFLNSGQSLSLPQEKLLLSVYGTSSGSNPQVVLSQDVLSLPLLNTALKHYMNQFKHIKQDKIGISTMESTLKHLSTMMNSSMKENIISSQIVYFTTEKLDGVSSELNQTLGELYGDNVDLHVIKVVYDFDVDVCMDTGFIELVEKFPNTRCTTVFNDPLCLARELFLSTKHMFKPHGREMSLFVSKNSEPLKMSLIPSITLNDFELFVSDRICQCHEEKVNSNVLYTQLQKGFVCSSTLKIIDFSDTIPVLRIGNGSREVLYTSGYDEKCLTLHTNIEMCVLSRVKLCSMPYELLFGETFLLIPSIDIDLSMVEKNESEIYYLCRHLVDTNEGLLCTSETSLRATSIKDSCVKYHFLIVADVEMKCLVVRQVSTSDEVIPPVFLSRLSPHLPSSNISKELSDLELIEEFNPLSFNSNKINFVYKSIATALVQKRSSDMDRKPKWQSKDTLASTTGFPHARKDEATPKRSSNTEKVQSKKVKKLIFK
ncbi:hypothetical protein C9374_009655 [Naegleria lovaniensis]|uniref:Uncharacterized protein n=1 Tax=Naegleria lovaniensis TaxID=51637 RepID=A0AA88GXY5_NAELO|nr:uncharacterized protein C9374_009655 [Naegleria lovaniensis]KAG2393078.1 hypothetical protein C9374_009655 [Naegleria lovaniensis]